MISNPLVRGAFICTLVLFSSCARTPKPPLVDLRNGQNLSAFKLEQVRGTRDGDRLDAEAKFSDGISTVTVTMRFAVGSPTRLQSGRWEWVRDGRPESGSVSARSVMFLGGQDGPPSLGGSFDLLDDAGTPAYRITVPTTQLTVKLR